MRTALVITLAGVSLSGCGLETLFANAGHNQLDRPASKLSGRLQVSGQGITVSVADADGKVLEPFLSSIDGGSYELRLPSSTYTNLVVSERAGNTVLRALVPAVGEESAVSVDLDARSTAEALITETRLSADRSAWKQVTPVTYVATRSLIRAAFDQPGSATAELLKYVNLLISGGTDLSITGGDPVFFRVPVASAGAADGGVDAPIVVTSSPLDNNWLDQTRFDYVGDGKRRSSSADFDAKLAEVAKLYRPSGCPDTSKIRVMFTVNFNPGIKNGNCGVSDRFKWATDKPGKSMYFVSWIHKDSPYQDANFNPPTTVNAEIGAGVPNTLPMHDDGQAGDEVAGDNIWTIYFDVPRGLRMGFKYTWGTAGAVWTGTEEWPGNSRIIEAVDVNGDDLVYRRDVFGDEATNKDLGNLNQKGSGQITWDTVLRPGWGIEAREQPVDHNNDCSPAHAVWHTPSSVGPLTVACTQ